MSQVTNFFLEKDFVNQTADISTTTLYTPSADGNYIVTVYIVGGSSTAALSWNDGSSTLTRYIYPGVSAGAIQAIRATSGNAITISTSGYGSEFSLYATISQVGVSC